MPNLIALNKAVHLILDFEPLSNAFQDVGNAIYAGDPWLRRIDVSVLGFLAREDLPPVELPFHCALPEAAASREETASSHLSLKEEIDQFPLEEEKEEQGAPVIHISNAKEEFDRLSGVCTLGLVVVCVIDSSEEEEEEMALNLRKGLRDLMAGRNKGSSSKKAPKSQDLANLPPPTTTLGLIPIPNLKKKRKEQEVKQGKMVPQKGAKQQKIVKDRQASSVDSRKEPSGVEVRQQQRTWAPRLELDGTPIPWNSFIREFQRGHSTYITEALE